MKILYLLRHATAAPATPPAMSDFDRTLSGLGVLQARTVGRYMQSNRLVPDFVLSSAAIRTTQTAQIVMNGILGNKAAQVASNFDKELYAAPDEKLLAAIQAANQDCRTLMLVAHNPGIAELAFALGKIDHYEPGTLSVFTADCDNWAKFSAKTVKLEKVFVPEG
jgi:phosphohistidine phosphatase